MKYLLAAVFGLLSLLVLLTIQPAHEPQGHDISRKTSNIGQSSRLEPVPPFVKQGVSGPISVQPRMESKVSTDEEGVFPGRQLLVAEVRKEIELSHGVKLQDNLILDSRDLMAADTYEEEARLHSASFAAFHLLGEKMQAKYGNEPISNDLKERIAKLKKLEENMHEVARGLDRDKKARARNRDIHDEGK